MRDYEHTAEPSSSSLRKRLRSTSPQHSPPPDADDVNNGSAARVEEGDVEDEARCSSVSVNGEKLLLDLNLDLIELVLMKMDLSTLVNSSRTCKLFDTLINRRQHVVRSIVVRHCGVELAERWR